MRIEDAIKKIHSLRDGWVRASEIQRVRGGLNVSLGVYRGERGKKVQGWSIQCRGVRGFLFNQIDAGGLCLLPGTHPVARQFTAPQATLRWSSDEYVESLGAICEAHFYIGQDWIEPDIYQLWAITPGKRVYRGPNFLMREYAKTLRRIGAKPRLTLRKKSTVKGSRLRALVVGSPYLVATSFLAENLD